MNVAGGNTSTVSGWRDAWPDALAFAAGLTLAWSAEWQTKDLVWSLWLSSLLVGYAMIVWSIFRPAIRLVTCAWGERGEIWSKSPGSVVAAGTVYLVGGLFMLAFFTVHFGMFHYVHSVFLNSFFPVAAGTTASPGPGIYRQVVHDYWLFVPLAAVAERAAFRLSVPAEKEPDVSVKAADVNRRLANPPSGFTGMMSPYKNVIRLHLLIFFFAFAHYAKLENFAVYAVVYAVYFFPWRLLRRAPQTK